MKRIIQSIFLLIVLALTSSCAKEELIFTHEDPSFEVKDGLVLIEAMIPSVLAEGDEIYIAGEFNGGDKAAMTGSTWRMEKAADNSLKYGIYLDPTTFADGKTLADGFHFVSLFRGVECTGNGGEATHTLDVSVGNAYVEYIANWECAFLPVPDDMKTNGVMITVDNQTGWDALYLYAEDADGATVFGDEPGMLPTGRINKGNKIHLYYDTGADNFGKTINAVFSDGKGTKLPVYTFTLDKTADVIAKITGVESALYPAHDGTIRVYVEYAETKWSSINCYMYGDVNNLGAEWPGKPVSGSETINGVKYEYFEYALSDVNGLTEHLIFNGDGVQIPGTQEPVITFNPDETDYFYLIYSEFTTVTIDPYDRANDPQPAAPTFALMVEDLTGWEGLYLYDAGASSVFGKWPGIPVEDGNAVSEVYQSVLRQFNVKEADNGSDVELWFHNNSGSYAVYETSLAKNIVLTVTPDGVFTFNDTPRLFVENQSWQSIAMHAWENIEGKDVNLFGDWPGLQPSGKAYNKDGKLVDVFIIEEQHIDKEVNVIFNNNGAGKQSDAIVMTFDKNLNYAVNDEGVEDTGIVKVPCNIYIDDQTGWEEISGYIWGDAEIFGGWPGAVPTSSVRLGGKVWSVLTISEDYFGNTCNLIFNNNNGGTQLADFHFTADKDYFLTVTAEGVTKLDARPDTRIYINDRTGWDAIALYAWGDAEIFGGWPGALPSVETLEGVDYKCFTIAAECVGKSENLIFNNNNGGIQFDGPNITIGFDLFLDVEATRCTIIE